MHLGSKSKECLGSGDNYMRSEGVFTYSRSAYTNFLHEERKMRRLFFARRAYSTHFTRRVMKKNFVCSNEQIEYLENVLIDFDELKFILFVSNDALKL